MTVNTQRLAYQLSKSSLTLPDRVIKRDGTPVAFDIGRVERAVGKCFASLEEWPGTSLDHVVSAVATSVASRFGNAESPPTVEGIQDLVELALLSFHEVEAARAYITYRDRHARARGVEVPNEIKEVFASDAVFFGDDPGSRFNFYDKYSRFNWDLGRRETWPETVDRAVDHLRWEVLAHMFVQKGLGTAEEAAEHDLAGLRARYAAALPWWDGALLVSEEVFQRIHAAILHKRVMPSMRLLAMAGEAARRNSMAIYNCSYMSVKDVTAFCEAMEVSMAGCGVGYSVERRYVEQFPRIQRQTGQHLGTHWVEDTTEGWARAVRVGLEAWWSGSDVEFDYSLVRPAGTVLRVKGGRASGPEPLRSALAFLRSTLLSRQGTFLRTLDAHDMMCAVGEAAVQGGVRRTAMIALFDWDDDLMRHCKDGPWGSWPEIRANANNSAVWPENISDLDIAQAMVDMARAGSGEPGIFSRANAVRTRPERRSPAEFGTNPCGEIILRPYQFCNLSQAVARPGDTEADLADKVELATVIGKIQSLSTRFPGLRPEWKANCEEERLLGVDLTAQNDCERLRADNPDGAGLRRRMDAVVARTDEVYSAALGVPVSAARTCNKPAGNSTEFLGASANGIHAGHARYVLRRMIVSVLSPLFRVLREAGAPMRPQAGKTEATATKWVVEFVKETPEGAPVKGDLSAVDQCEFWLLNKENWTEHNPSCTITYQPSEIIDLLAWVCRHKDRIGGLSFFPVFDAVYPDQPFEEITREEYEARRGAWPEVDYSLVYAFEAEDMTTAAQTLACFAGSCEV